MSIIKNTREKSGYTQLALSKKTGLSLRTIQRLESNNKEPKGHTLSVLSEVFNMEPSILQDQFKNIVQLKKSENNFGQDIRNFRRFLEFAKSRNSKTVWFRYG